MHFTTAAVASGLLLAGAVSAQSYPAFNPDSIAESQKIFWCEQQISACPLLCNDRKTTTQINECYPENLFYTCICSDGKSPELAEYSQTIPYFTCITVVEECVANCEGNGICGGQCRENKPCGAQGDPTKNKTTTDTKSSTKTTTSLPTATQTGDDFEAGFGSTKDTKDKDSGASSILSFKSSYGLASVIVGLAAGFTIFL